MFAISYKLSKFPTWHLDKCSLFAHCRGAGLNSYLKMPNVIVGESLAPYRRYWRDI